MNKLLEMKDSLIHAVQAQLYNLDSADCKELGGAIDMIKDLAEAAYYCTITEAMEEKYTSPQTNYYSEYRPYERDMDKDYGRMYYSDSGSSSGMGSHSGMSSSKNFQEQPLNWETMRDRREGRSPMKRKNYMESKEMHMDKTHQMQELETYMNELSNDLTEIIEGASPEEKSIL